MKFKCLTLFWSIHSSHNRLRWSKGQANFNGIPSTLPRGSFTLKTHQMFSVHPTSGEFHSKNPSAVFRPQNSVRNSHDCRNAIIFEKLSFQNFCSPENNKSAFLNSPTAHFSWRISLDGRPKLRFQIPLAHGASGCRQRNSLWLVTFYRVTLSRSRSLQKSARILWPTIGRWLYFDSFSSRNFSLCEITVEDGGLIKQRRLPDMLTNLPDRIHLNGRSVNSQS